MDRSEIVRRLILISISDDYENVDQVILRQVAKTGAKLGLAIGRPEIVDALAGLVADGLAKAYLFPPREHAAQNSVVCRRSTSLKSISKPTS
jgi:hypothetical protein